MSYKINDYNSLLSKSKCMYLKEIGSYACLRTILNCFPLEHCAFKTKHLKMSSIFLNHALKLLENVWKCKGLKDKKKYLG